MSARVPRSPPKSKMRMRLAILLVILGLGGYSYFAYNKEIFPFTKENKAKLNKLFKGGKVSDTTLEDILAAEEGMGGLVDELGTPSGGTGALGFDESGSLNEPRAKGIESLYQQGLYRQLFEPFDSGVGDLTKEPGQITIGGDVPSSSVQGSLPQPYNYPFPVDERLNDMYGLYPPGGSYGNRTDPYSPIYPGDWGGGSGSGGGSGKPPIDPRVFECNNCGPGMSWDSCSCRCAPEDEPRLMCFREECACPEEREGGRHGNGGWWRGGRGPRDDNDDLPPIPEIPNIPEWIPDEALADIGQLRDVRDRLLQEIDALQEELQNEIDELNDKIEEEKEKRQELEDVVEEIQEEMAEEPEEEHHSHREEWTNIIAIATANHDGVKVEIKQMSDAVKITHSQLESKTSEAQAVTSHMQTVASTGGYSGRRRSSSSGSGATATAGGGSATACAGGKCITAGQAKIRAFRVRAGRQERNFAFAKLQHKAKRMNTLKVPPTAHLKNRQFMNILPPIVARRHFATRIVQS